MELRPYQKQAVRKAVRNLTSSKRVALVMPTGAGKTVVASEICKHFQPVLWVAHQKELLKQARKALKRAEITDFDLLSSASKNIPSRRFNLLVIDEFHHEACNSHTNILSSVEHLKLLGITATPDRLDKNRLRFDERVDVVGQRDLIDDGYLAPIRLFRVRLPNHPSRCASDLACWANIHKSYIGKTIFFVRDLKEAKIVQNMLQMSSEIISGTSDRELQLERFKEQTNIQCLISCLLLTEGVDLPMCKTVILGRKTKSKALLSQMIGRSLRIYPGKKYCNVVEPVWVYDTNHYVRTESIIEPDEKYISTLYSISDCKTRRL